MDVVDTEVNETLFLLSPLPLPLMVLLATGRYFGWRTLIVSAEAILSHSLPAQSEAVLPDGPPPAV